MLEFKQKFCFSSVNSVSDRTIKKQQTFVYNSKRFRYKYFPIEDAIQLFVPTKTIVARQSNKRTKRYSGLIRCAMMKMIFFVIYGHVKATLAPSHIQTITAEVQTLTELK